MKVSEIEERLAEYRDLGQRINFLQGEIGLWSVEPDQYVNSAWSITANSTFLRSTSPYRFFYFPRQNRDDIVAALKAYIEVLTAKRDALEIETDSCSSKPKPETEQD